MLPLIQTIHVQLGILHSFVIDSVRLQPFRIQNLENSFPIRIRLHIRTEFHHGIHYVCLCEKVDRTLQSLKLMPLDIYFHDDWSIRRELKRVNRISFDDCPFLLFAFPFSSSFCLFVFIFFLSFQHRNNMCPPKIIIQKRQTKILRLRRRHHIHHMNKITKRFPIFQNALTNSPIILHKWLNRNSGKTSSGGGERPHPYIGSDVQEVRVGVTG
mmetsp:Transcript_25656/g.52226  ORF Transcript_25656/g.52226 Transcript_25656/m.52226 type:complete len:213 (+) Transcript_25656:208-846(+)